MRIPFPERVSYSSAFIFAGVLCGVLLLEGSNPVMLGLVFCDILVATVAFNVAGGMFYPSGVYIGANVAQTLLLPMVAKAFLREPAEANLHVPVRTMEVYLLGMVAMLFGALVSRRMRRRNALISDMLPMDNLRPVYIGCIVFALLLQFLSGVLPSGDGSIGSLLNQVNRFAPLAFLLGTIHTIHSSQGRRSLTWPLLSLMVLTGATGFLTYSKEAFLTPFFCWAVGSAFMRYKLRPINIAAFAAGLWLTVTYLVPYAQVGRNATDEGYGGYGSVVLARYMLTHFGEIRAKYDESADARPEYHEYDRSMGILDRLDVLAIDDGLVQLTDQEGFYGYFPLLVGFENAIPHALWHDKPGLSLGNLYAHQLGMMATEDYTTGISFSPLSDAYHEGGIFCLLIVCPPLFALMFTFLDSMVGDTRRNPLCLLFSLVVFRLGPEGLLLSVITLGEQPLAATVMASYMAKYILPLVGRIFMKTPVEEDMPIAPPSPSLPVLSA